MSDAPETRRYSATPLLVMVETGPETGQFVLEPRCHCAGLTLGCDENVSSATIDVYTGPIALSGMDAEEALKADNVLNAKPWPPYARFVSPDQQILIVRPRQDVVLSEGEGEGEEAITPAQFEGLDVLLRGYCDRPSYESLGGGGGGGSSRKITLEVESVWKRLSDLAGSQIVGRYMRSSDSQAALRLAIEANEEDETFPDQPFGSALNTTLVTGRPCVFNADGFGNCARTPVAVTVAGREHTVYVFGDDHTPGNVLWTWARALGYLVYYYQLGDPMLNVPEESEWNKVALVADGNLFEDTANLLSPTATRPIPPVSAANGWAFAMLGEPQGLQCEMLNFPEAAVMACDAAGLHCRVETALDEVEAAVVDRLHWWARGTGAVKNLYKEATFADRNLAVSDLLAKNNVRDLIVNLDYGDVVVPRVVGDVRRYEITAELVPGWKPNADADDVADTGAAMTAAEAHQDLTGDDLRDDAWYQKYHKSGSAFTYYANVGRRWILNTTGYYQPGDYARLTGPFVEAAYDQWQPSLPYGPLSPDRENLPAGFDEALLNPLRDHLLNDAGAEVWEPIEEGAWAPVTRPFAQCLTADEDGRSIGIVVEISCDGGDNWGRIEGGCKALATESGIYIDEPDLTTLQTDAESESFWEALINNQARVRVTAVIEGDSRLEPNLRAANYGVPIEGTTRLFDMSRQFAANTREGGNSQYGPDGELYVSDCTQDETDDLLSIQRWAAEMLEILSGRQQAVSATIPWLEFRAYSVGDCVSSVTGTGLELVMHALGQQRRHVDIVGIQYTDRTTTLLLDDTRLDDLPGAI